MREFTGLRVLLVEDEGGVALLLEDMLEELGCLATSVAHIPQAFQAVEDRSFDFAVLDVNLGGVTSFDLARMLLRRGTPLVFSTGYGASVLPTDLAGCPVLAKPFTLEGLRAKIGQCIGAGGR
ncbi:MAG TPA: response regulator [Caulobacter sp.]|nr:response regulator [Caulobacter sp.]